MGKESTKDFEKQREIVRNLRAIDDACFEYLMQDINVCQEILRVILQDADLIVKNVIPQKSVHNLNGRSVRLDAYCILGDGSSCNVEVQKGNKNDHLRRCRYNASCITANIENPGEKFENVPDVCIIYISTFDVFGAGKTIYHTKMYVEETMEPVNDGLREIFVNTKNNDGSLIAQLMQEFIKENIDGNKFPELSNRMHQLKNDDKEVSHMCKAIEDYANERAAAAVAEAEAKAAAKEAAVTTATRLKAIADMIDLGIAKDAIMSKGYTAEEIKKALKK